jgi:ABC-type antimicrobial peptide transport system permease subunit
MIVSSASAQAAVDQVMTMEARLERTLTRPRLAAALLVGFAAFALLVAGIGLFGGLAYGVTQRTREIGVRTALGATPWRILVMVMKQGTAMTAIGVIVGFGVAAASVRYLGAFLFGVTPFDLLTYVATAGATFAVAVVACAIPAWRAARIDALAALRK